MPSQSSPFDNPAGFTWNAKFPSFNQWIKLPRVLTRKEKRILLLFLILFLGSLTFLTSYIYQTYTVAVPAKGGSMTEGMVGSPRFLNPVYAEVNDTDRSLTQLLFSGLLRYDNEGNLVGDLASEYSVLEGGRVYEVTLKNNIRWHDGYAFDADDILFTVQTIQDPRYKSPIRANWVGVDVQKISATKVRFVLKDPFAAFAERLTLKILPKHLWQEITPENFALSIYNLQPVGTGPYRLIDVKRDKSGSVKEITLKAHSKYHGEGPYIATLIFKFFETQEDLLKEADAGKLQSFSLVNPAPSRFRDPALLVYEFSLPRSYSLFFNLQASSPVAKRDIREALKLGIDQNELNESIFTGNAILLSSPLRGDLYGFESPPLSTKDIERALSLFAKEGYQPAESGSLVKITLSQEFTADLRRGSQGTQVIALQECLAKDPKIYPGGIVNGVFGPATQQAVIAFQEKYVKDILAPSSLSKGTGTVGPSTRAKLNEICSAPQDDTPLYLTLTTLDQSPLKEVASFIAKSWEELGIETEVKVLTPGELERDVLKPRNFEILLFGEVLGRVPDPLPFWHSSQVKDPGLNLSGYDSSDADTLLEQIRRTGDVQERKAFLAQLQELLVQDLPALPLYDLTYQYVVSNEIKGVKEQLLSEPGQRFSGVLDWYIKTRRVWSF
ncbi:MAG: ABC transporter substrate-binding protein [bacterium]|nr:ABC transporter substrate-binding protein [bacterium]